MCGYQEGDIVVEREKKEEEERRKKKKKKKKREFVLFKLYIVTLRYLLVSIKIAWRGKREWMVVLLFYYYY